jgi:hypothetical protein
MANWIIGSGREGECCIVIIVGEGQWGQWRHMGNQGNWWGKCRRRRAFDCWQWREMVKINIWVEKERVYAFTLAFWHGPTPSASLVAFQHFWPIQLLVLANRVFLLLLVFSHPSSSSSPSCMANVAASALGNSARPMTAHFAIQLGLCQCKGRALDVCEFTMK